MQFTMENIKENPRFVTMPQVHPAQVDCLCDVPGCLYMKEIKLTQGKVTLVDDEDFEYLNQWKWYANKIGKIFYAYRSEWLKDKQVRKFILMHRLIMQVNTGLYIDHINHDGLDNRKQNLRIVSNRVNSWNRINKSEYTGVYKHRRKYKAIILINGKQKYLGMFSDPAEAHNIYMLEYQKSLLQ